jgi:hypothetical protein
LNSALSHRAQRVARAIIGCAKECSRNALERRAGAVVAGGGIVVGGACGGRSAALGHPQAAAGVAGQF